jgi:hypothetical protein
MTLLKAEVWQAGRRVTCCKVIVDAHDVHIVVGTDVPLPDGNYEIRRGGTIQKLTYADGEWLARRR